MQFGEITGKTWRLSLLERISRTYHLSGTGVVGQSIGPGPRKYCKKVAKVVFKGHFEKKESNSRGVVPAVALLRYRENELGGRNRRSKGGFKMGHQESFLSLGDEDVRKSLAVGNGRSQTHALGNSVH